MGGDLVTILVVGLLAGWLAGKIQKGKGFGIAGNLVIGVLGSVFGTWLFEQLGFAAYGFAGHLVEAVVGALVILFLLGAVAKRG
jgi:uncharacterized membrane protein YeaQ/YmgE (transglycosylase-associated protein family)